MFPPLSRLDHSLKYRVRVGVEIYSIVDADQGSHLLYLLLLSLF